MPGKTHGRPTAVIAKCNHKGCDKQAEFEALMRNLLKDPASWLHILFCDKHVRKIVHEWARTTPAVAP